jgi:peptidoglycan hydrolase CwlO-like protein
VPRTYHSTDIWYSEQLESDINTAHSEVKDAKASYKRVEIELNTMQDEIAEAQVCICPWVNSEGY